MATLRQIREANYISRRELAELADVSESTIVRIETSDHKSQEEVVTKVLTALGKKVGQDLTIYNVEGLKLYNIMRDRRQRGQEAKEQKEQPGR